MATSALPEITRHNLTDAIKVFKKNTKCPMLFSKPNEIKELQRLRDSLAQDNDKLSRDQILELFLLHIKTPTSKKAVDYAFTHLDEKINAHILGAIKATLGLLGVNDNRCLADCLELMFAYPHKALDIAMAKSALYLLQRKYSTNEALNQFYKEVNYNHHFATLISNIISNLSILNQLVNGTSEFAVMVIEASLPKKDNPRFAEECPQFVIAETKRMELKL